MINQFLSIFKRTKAKSDIIYDPQLEILHGMHKTMGIKSDYYDENFLNVKAIVDAIVERYKYIRPLHFLVVGQMQSGKTNNIKTFLETSCGKIPLDSRLFTCGDGDKSIFKQNDRRLRDVIHVRSIVIFNRQVRKGKIDLNEIKLLILDEDQFAQGENSQVHILLKRLYVNYPDLIVLRITGTPGGMSSYGFQTIFMKTGQGYVGPAEFLKRGQIKDIRKCYNEGGLYYGKKDPYFYTDSSAPGVTSIHIKDHLKQELSRLAHLKGYGCMRYSRPDVAKREISAYVKTMGWNIEILIAHQNHSKSGHHKSITEVLQEAWELTICDNKTVLVIFENALKAGFDFDANTPKECWPIKERLVFFYELTDSNWNSHLQGGPGRCSGYHNNTNVHIYANLELVQLYSDWVSGYITHEELDIRIGEIDRAKSPGSPVNAATHVRSIKREHKIKTWMDTIELEEDYERQLLKMRKKLESIGEGFEPEPLIDLMKAYELDNEHAFGNGSVSVKLSSVSFNGKDYFMNGKAWSNYANKSKIDGDLERIINTGKINRENIKNHKSVQSNMNVAIMTLDHTPGERPTFYLCLLNGDVDLPKKELHLEDKTFYQDSFYENKY
jgi:hypothetical protein